MPLTKEAGPYRFEKWRGRWVITQYKNHPTDESEDEAKQVWVERRGGLDALVQLTSRMSHKQTRKRGWWINRWAFADTGEKRKGYKGD